MSIQQKRNADFSVEQLLFFNPSQREKLEDKILDLQKKISNFRSGLFKRYSEMEKAIEFLEGEVEDLVKANLEKFG
jgi:hypothetical protein